MTYLLVVQIAFKSLVTSGIALLLLALLKNRTAAERSWIAHAGLLATLALPVAVFLLPKWGVEAPHVLPHVLVAPAPAPPAGTLVQSAPGAAAAEAVMAQPSLSAETLLLWGYAIPAALLLLTTLAAVLRLFALRRRASIIVEQAWLSALAHAQRRMGFKHGTALLVSSELTSPVSWGILRPIILLNEEAIGSHKEAEAIIAHELAHVARLDWAKLLLARAATSLFWFNPLVWRLARHCHQLREEAADDAVLRSVIPGTDYAALLVGAARHENKAMLLAAHGVAPGRGSLEQRVRRVLDTRLSRAPVRYGWTSACCAGALLIAAPLAALTPVLPLDPSIDGLPLPQRNDSEGSSVRSAALVQPEAAAGIGPGRAPEPSPAAKGLDPAVGRGVEQPQAVAAHSEATAPPPRVHASIPPDILVQMRVHGVTPEYARELAAISPAYARLTPEQLVTMRVQEISVGYVRELAELGYPNLSHRDLVAMAVQEVTPAFIREMAALGYRSLSADQLVTMRVQGVTPAFVREMAATGYRGLSADELVTMRVQGVSPDYVREFMRAGYRDLTAQDLIKLRVQGVRLSSDQLVSPENRPTAMTRRRGSSP